MLAKRSRQPEEYAPSFCSFLCLPKGMVAKYCLFVLEVVTAWIDPEVKNPRTIHHLGSGNFMVAGEKIKLKSKMK